MRNINQIIIHCTATKAGRAVAVKEIDSWHRSRGFRGIGYHYVIGLDGKVERGRDESVAGAHCKGHNSHSIGVCYVGGLDAAGKSADTRTQAQRKSLQQTVAMLLRRYPGATVHGHYEFANKACPCFNVKSDL